MRKSSRNRVKVDYVALNQAQWRQHNVHPHWNRFIDFHPSSNNVIEIINDTKDKVFDNESLKKLIDSNKLTTPILIPGANPKIKDCYNPNIQLDFEFPHLTIDELTNLIGPEHNVPVMNVMTQNNINKWDMNQWRDYFVSDPKKSIMNVISLEFSESKLGPLVEIPQIVKEMDLVTNLFHNDQLNDLLINHGIESPKVQKYILMSVKGCFTDFHIDFAATSVYYSPIMGHKKFIMFPPLKRNLDIYKKWCLSSNQNETWFPDLIPKLKPSEIKAIKSNPDIPNSYINDGLIVEVKRGDLLLLPSGWIHAVITLEDSLVFGGNFLNLISLENHLNAYQVELETRVGEQFKFPKFITFLWLFAYSIIQNDGELNDFELKCINHLMKFLKTQWFIITNPPIQRSQRATKVQRETIARIKAAIPYEIIGKDIESFLNELQEFLNDQKKLNDLKHGLEPDLISVKRQRID